MAEIQTTLSGLNDTVISPIYSWVSQFQNFIMHDASWSTVCGSAAASVLDFDEQLKKFVNIKVESDCCQHNGICGEQFVSDIIFDDSGKVSATRVRFQHKPLKYQSDFINALVETRRAADMYVDQLIPNRADTPEISLNFEKPPNTLINNLLEIVGFQPQQMYEEITTAPNAFTYSLFYVYYDQYTYIRGVLSQNALLGVAAVMFSLQFISGLSISVIISLCVFLVMFELMGTMFMLNEVLGGYPIEINAVFVVNLVTSLGFGVEFCNHLAMNFMTQSGTREQRARKALGQMGSSILVGIASTKFIGVLVLAFAPSTMFKLYYFRMYLFIIFIGCFNGLMFLPLVLRWFGPMPDISDIKEKEEMRREFEELLKKKSVKDK
jgi:Niemann-Pick C1 protein